MIDGGGAAHTIAVRLHFGAEFAHLHPTVVRVIFAKNTVQSLPSRAFSAYCSTEKTSTNIGRRSQQ